MFSAGAPRFSEEKSGAFSPVSLLLVDVGGRLSDAVLPVRKGNCFCCLPSFPRFLDICIGFFVPGKPRSFFLYAFQNDVLKECCFLKIRCIFCLDSICPTCFYERENVPFSAAAIPPLFFCGEKHRFRKHPYRQGAFFLSASCFFLCFLFFSIHVFLFPSPPLSVKTAFFVLFLFRFHPNCIFFCFSRRFFAFGGNLFRFHVMPPSVRPG